MIKLLDRAYQKLLPLTLQADAQSAHHAFITALRLADTAPPALWAARWLAARTLPAAPQEIGGVALPHPLILAAGLVKGDGFEDEQAALGAVTARRNVVPGWRTLPIIAGPVEFGSYTRHPRPGNPGIVMWRDSPTRSTQNRVGLKNPGAVAAAAFLAARRGQLPQVFGVNIAVSPGITNPDQEQQEATEALGAFLQQGVRPSWFTLNLSCPNTEDDPSGNQTTDKAKRLGTAMAAAAGDVPLWVKVGPCLGDEQYTGLMRAFADVGVRAVVATNTLPAPTPDGTQTAGVGGGKLHAEALRAVRQLAAARQEHGYPVDIIGCGGVQDGPSYAAMRTAGADAAMYYSALIFRGPLAAAIIHQERTPTHD